MTVFPLYLGQIRGVACSWCNSSIQVEHLKSIPLFFHNATSFDNNLIIKHYNSNLTKHALKGLL